MGEALGFRVKRYSEEQLLRQGFHRTRVPRSGWLPVRMPLRRPPGCRWLFFSYPSHHPKFGFSFLEQETLKLALDGRTDESIAQVTGVSLSTTKKRFRAIYDKVQNASADPETVICAESLSDGARGPEMRRTLLNYLRAHPEELRPYSVERMGLRANPS